MKRSAIAAALALAWCFGSHTASAGVLELRGEIHAGGATGQGVSGAQMDNAFHEGAAGMAYGGLVGVEILLVDVWVEHNQFRDANALVGTWTQFMAGLDMNVDLGDKTKGVEVGADGKAGQGGFAPLFAEMGVAIGFGVGTGQQVVLPLDNSEITDKGFLVQGHFALGYRLTSAMSLGLMVPVQGAFMFKSGAGAANETSTQYRSVQGAALLNLRMDWTLR